MLLEGGNNHCKVNVLTSEDMSKLPLNIMNVSRDKLLCRWLLREILNKLPQSQCHLVSKAIPIKINSKTQKNIKMTHKPEVETLSQLPVEEQRTLHGYSCHSQLESYRNRLLAVCSLYPSQWEYKYHSVLAAKQHQLCSVTVITKQPPEQYLYITRLRGCNVI